MLDRSGKPANLGDRVTYQSKSGNLEGVLEEIKNSMKVVISRAERKFVIDWAIVLGQSFGKPDIPRKRKRKRYP
jgi:hypothetical protein